MSYMRNFYFHFKFQAKKSASMLEKGPVHTHFLSLSSTLYIYKTVPRTPKYVIN